MTGAAAPPETAGAQPAYRVLARKYRPSTFAGLIGQEAMVRTLSNAIRTGRIAHAFVLTGVRGVGKTTTARIIARALNCVGPDGTGGATIDPCGVCPQCVAIGEDRHVDVMEMDAASRTGVDDIRELTDSVRYKPVSARFKIYIIDEVHMLSKNAFNALLKTLEEPPPDVKFVFATTEIHKVPITVLSRCQRFSLRRVPADLLAQHYGRVAAAEAVAVAPGALALIARAADGSVRDGLSLLDQAIALSGGAVDEGSVRDMLGIADRGTVFDLFGAVLAGDPAGALALLAGLYENGADPALVMQDLLEIAHLVTRLKVTPQAGADDAAAEGDRTRARPLADRLSIPVLARAWQMLLKGIAEVQAAPSPIQAAEMVLVRLAYIADLPAPADLVRALDGATAPVAVADRGARPTLAATPPAIVVQPPAPPSRIESGGATALARQMPAPLPAPVETIALAPEPLKAPEHEPMPQSFAEVVALFDRRREALTRSQLVSNVHLVAFEPGRIEFRPAEGAPRDLASRLGQRLGEWTGQRWVVAVSGEAGAPTLRQEEQRRDQELRHEVAAHPLVQAVLDAFPGAAIEAVRERFTALAEPAEATDGTTPQEDPT